MRVKVVRIYLTEGEELHQQIFDKLQQEHGVMGVTVYRGIEGFGRSGEIHPSTLLDVSFDLPVVIEFFDDSDKVEAALDSLDGLLPKDRVLILDASNR